MFISIFSLFLLDSGEFSTSRQGNVIRLYALQAVSAKVMRKVINNLSNTFRENIEEVKKRCESNARHTWAKEFLSSNYVIYCIYELIAVHIFKNHEKVKKNLIKKHLIIVFVIFFKLTQLTRQKI